MLLDESRELVEVATTPLIPRQGNEWGRQHRAGITQGDADPDRTDIHPESPPPTGIIDTGAVRTTSGRPAAPLAPRLFLPHASQCPPSVVRSALSARPVRPAGRRSRPAPRPVGAAALRQVGLAAAARRRSRARTTAPACRPPGPSSWAAAVVATTKLTLPSTVENSATTPGRSPSRLRTSWPACAGRRRSRRPGTALATSATPPTSSAPAASSPARRQQARAAQPLQFLLRRRAAVSTSASTRRAPRHRAPSARPARFCTSARSLAR